MNKTPYSHGCFAKAYYEGNGVGGANYNYNHPDQQDQLSIKGAVLSRIDFQSILFVGCAKGFEVRHFREKLGKEAFGIDISSYATSRCEPSVRDFVQHYDGTKFPFPDNAFDAVAAFDVVGIPPENIAENILSEMARVSRKHVYFRTHVLTPYQNPDIIHAWDGADVTYRSFDWWLKTMTSVQGGKFGPREGRFSWHMEFDFYFDTDREHIEYLTKDGV